MALENKFGITSFAPLMYLEAALAGNVVGCS